MKPDAAKSQRDDMNLGPPRTPVAPLGLGVRGFLATMGSRPWLHPAVPSGLRTKTQDGASATLQESKPIGGKPGGSGTSETFTTYLTRVLRASDRLAGSRTGASQPRQGLWRPSGPMSRGLLEQTETVHVPISRPHLPAGTTRMALAPGFDVSVALSPRTSGFPGCPSCLDVSLERLTYVGAAPLKNIRPSASSATLAKRQSKS